MMKTNLLKPGDKVVRKNGKVIMQALRYPKMYHKFLGWHEDQNFLVCSWYDTHKGRVEEIIPQVCLSKVKQRNIPHLKSYKNSEYQISKT